MSKLMSISELSERERVTPDLPMVWDFQLPPHVDAERLQINVSRLRLLHRIGAFAASLVTSYNGEVSEYTPGITGINADGSALVGKAGVAKKSDKSKGAYADIADEYCNENFGTTVAVHQLNKPELASQVADRKQASEISEEKAWANQLDEALRHSMRQSARDHLTRRNYAGLRAVGYWNGVYGVLGTIGAIAEVRPTIGLGVYAFLQTVPELERAARIKFFNENPNRRFSLFPSIVQPDRYAAVNGLARVSGLVRAQK